MGPDKAIDTKKYFVICSNVLGGCMGSFGPSHKDPNTQNIFGTNFPVITINDMVNAQYNLLEHFADCCRMDCTGLLVTFQKTNSQHTK